MLSHMLKAKLHMAKVTQAELWYDGSCAIDANLVALADMLISLCHYLVITSGGR